MTTQTASDSDQETISSIASLGSATLDLADLAIVFGSNNIGSAVGFQPGPVADFWRGSLTTHFSPLSGYSGIVPDAINDENQVVGCCVIAGSQSGQAFLWQNGTVLAIGPAQGYSDATAINNQGQVVGYGGAVGTSYNAFLWQNGSWSYLPSLAGVTSQGAAFVTEATSINDIGQIVGNALNSQGNVHAVLWDNGVIQDLGTLAGATSSSAASINDLGQVVGISGTSAFLWQNGNMAALAALSGYADTAAESINESGIVVGYAENTANGSYRAVMWVDGQAIDLNSLLPANSGWVLTSAVSIGDNDQIYGSGTYDGIQTSFTLTLGSGTIGVSAETALQSSAKSSSRITVYDSAAHVQADLDSLQELTTQNKINFVALTDSGSPTLTISGQQLASDSSVLQDISGPFLLTVTGTTTAAALIPSLYNHLTSVTIEDSLANILANLGNLNPIASQIASIILTDSGIPTLSISAAPSSNYAALGDIRTPFDVSELYPGSSGPGAYYSGWVGHGSTLVFSDASSNYSLATEGISSTVVVSRGDQYFNVENFTDLQFSDMTVFLAQTPGSGTVTSGNVTELYGAVLAREPDVAGLAFYESYLANNPSTPLLTFAEWFLASPEYANNPAHTYAESAAGNAQFIIDSYQNLLSRLRKNAA